MYLYLNLSFLRFTAIFLLFCGRWKRKQDPICLGLEDCLIHHPPPLSIHSRLHWHSASCFPYSFLPSILQIPGIFHVFYFLGIVNGTILKVLLTWKFRLRKSDHIIKVSHYNFYFAIQRRKAETKPSFPKVEQHEQYVDSLAFLNK